MRKLRKVTIGFVIQEYVEAGDTFVCVGQEFTCGDEVTWETPGGEVVDTPADHIYQPFEMEQPEVPPEVVDEAVRQAEEEQRRVKERGFVIDPGNWFE